MLSHHAQVFMALASEHRLAIMVLLLQQGELPVGDISGSVGVVGPTLSHHLRFLARAGLITQRREGRYLWCKAEARVVRRLGMGMIDAADPEPALVRQPRTGLDQAVSHVFATEEPAVPAPQRRRRGRPSRRAAYPSPFRRSGLAYRHPSTTERTENAV